MSDTQLEMFAEFGPKKPTKNTPEHLIDWDTISGIDLATIPGLAEKYARSPRLERERANLRRKINHKRKTL